MCRLSYVEGRLKLAEKERQRALKAKEAVPEDGVSKEELAALNAKADANMAALLQEEAAQKVRPCLLLHDGMLFTMIMMTITHAIQPSVTSLRGHGGLWRLNRRPRRARRRSARGRRARRRVLKRMQPFLQQLWRQSPTTPRMAKAKLMCSQLPAQQRSS